MVQFWQMLEDDNGQSKFLNFKEWNWYFFSLIENAESTMIVLGFIFLADYGQICRTPLPLSRSP